jgi:hypothetical protein
MAVKTEYGTIEVVSEYNKDKGTATFTFDWKGDTALISLELFKDSYLIVICGIGWIKIGPYDATIVGYHNGCLVVKRDDAHPD